MAEPLGDIEPTWEELLGYTPDLDRMAERYPDLLDGDGNVDLDRLERIMIRKIDLAEKLRKYDSKASRAPVAPHLPEIQDQLQSAIFVERFQREAGRDPYQPEQENILQLFGFWDKESFEADRHFYG